MSGTGDVEAPNVMAPLMTRWILSIFLVGHLNCFPSAVPEGPPVPPSLPECYIPCDQKSCLELNIYCTWDQRQETQIPTNYSLHWEPANSEEGLWINGSSSDRFIFREHFSNHGELRVWVQAKNQHGSVKSQEIVFNTADIIKPLPPVVTSSHQEALEISWNSICVQLDLSLGFCEVRHRMGTDQVWFEDEGGFYVNYTPDSLQPCTSYEFQVRCACGTGLSSDWSAIHRVHGIDTSPVGELDIWRDCGIIPTSLDCVLTWKRLPVSQACGLILGYEVRLSYNNGTAALVNVSATVQRDHLLCDEMHCYLTSFLKDTSSVSVSAYNAHGATVPSYLAMPLSGKEKNQQALHLTMNEESLNLSWDLPSQLSNNLKKYVVQYKQAGCPLGQSFDWVKVNKSQTTAFFKGRFKKYTPYQVSLFTVLHSGEIHSVSSVIGYSLQRIPSRVPSLKVFSIAATYATLLWEPVPLFKQDGMILYYQIGLGTQNVYNVSAFPQTENQTFQLPHLSSGQKYEAWIRGVTAAGHGEKATVMFETKHHDYLGYSVLCGVIFLFVIFLLILTSTCCGEWRVDAVWSPCYCDKVPDPRNSHIFRDMKHQINDPVAWICIPVYEPHPEISFLEFEEIRLWASKSHLEKKDADGSIGSLARDGTSHTDCQNEQREDAIVEECHRTDHKYGREAYSKMLDSDEERERDDYCSSEEERSVSGYEKHFMPTALEILEVS